MDKKMILVEKGSYYSWTYRVPVCICENEKCADDFIANKAPFSELYSKSPLPYYSETGTKEE